MSAPPLLRAPGINKNKNPKSPRLKLATLQVPSSQPQRLSMDRPIYQDAQNSTSSGSLLSATNRLAHLDISDNSHISTPSTATSDMSSAMFSAEIMAEIETTSSLCDKADERGEEQDEEATLQRNYKDVGELDEEEWKVINKRGEIIELGILGEGAGGSVSRCKLKYGTTVFALKTIISDASAETQKQILRELQFNKSCKSEHIVKYYGMFLNEENASICISMEYMGGRSLDAIYKKVKDRGGRIGEKVLGKIAESVLKGLSYLHENRIIHRDIKPQNILLDSQGHVKLCDFGVSGIVVNSLATTFTGTSYYMAPERIQGHPYSVTSDVWSLGLTLLEVAKGQFPLDVDIQGTSPFEVLTLIMTFAPRLEDEDGIVWSNAFRSFIDYCLKKNPEERASPRQMLLHPWVVGQSKKNVNMEKFIQQCWDDTTKE